MVALCFSPCWQCYCSSTQWQIAYLHQCGGRFDWRGDRGPLVQGGARRNWRSRNATAPSRGGARFHPSSTDSDRDWPDRPFQTAQSAPSLPSPSQTKQPRPRSVPVPVHELLTFPFCPISVPALHPLSLSALSLSALRLLPLPPTFPYSFTTPSPQDGGGLLRPAQPWQPGNYQQTATVFNAAEYMFICDSIIIWLFKLAFSGFWP